MSAKIGALICCLPGFRTTSVQSPPNPAGAQRGKSGALICCLSAKSGALIYCLPGFRAVSTREVETPPTNKPQSPTPPGCPARHTNYPPSVVLTGDGLRSPGLTNEFRQLLSSSPRSLDVSIGVARTPEEPLRFQAEPFAR